MAISVGMRIGPYEILAPIGAGGMGEVYRARDTRLEREVAIKVLPAHLSANPDLKQRFEREAHFMASLPSMVEKTRTVVAVPPAATRSGAAASTGTAKLVDAPADASYLFQRFVDLMERR